MPPGIVQYKNTNIYVHGTRHQNPNALPWGPPRKVAGIWVFKKPGAMGWVGVPAQYDFGASAVGDFDAERVGRIVGHLDVISATGTGRAVLREIAAHAPHVVEITSKLADSTCASAYAIRLAHFRRRLPPMDEYAGPAITSQDVGVVYDPYEEVDPWCRTLVPGPPEIAGDVTLLHELMHACELMTGRDNVAPVPTRLESLEGWRVPRFTDLGEFHAVVVQNVYSSEKNPGASLRWGHPGIRPLLGPLTDPAKFCAVFFDEISRMRDRYPRLFEDLRALRYVRWNPVALWRPE